MPRAATRTRRAEIEEISAWASAPAWYVVRPRVLLHARREKEGPRCPCCQSPLAHITSEQAITPLLIRTSDGARHRRDDPRIDTDVFDALAERAHFIDFPLRVADIRDAERDVSPLEMLWDFDSVAHIVAGGNRSGKSGFATHAWLPLRWLYRGGKNRLFRIMAPELGQTHLLKEKMFVGEGETPPSFPPELITRVPEHERSQDQHVRLIDGSSFHLTHTKSSSHLKGVSIEAQIGTEACEIRDESVWHVSVARTDTGGQTLFESTPVKSHWLEPIVLDAERTKPSDDGTRRAARVMCMRSVDNPWKDPKDVLARREAAMKVDPILARREFDGEWVGNDKSMFLDVWRPDEHVIELPSGPHRPRLRDYGLIDVTEAASRAFFGARHRHEWVIGVDVNRNPHTAVVCKIYARQGDEHKDPKTWGVLVYDEVRTSGDAHDAARALYEAQGGMYRNAGICIDAKSAESRHAAHTGVNSAMTPKKSYEKFGFNVRPNKHPKTGKPWNPFVRDSTALVKLLMREDHFLINSTNAPGTIQAIELQEDRGDGKPVKVSNTFSDSQIAAFTDSLRYITWPIFNRTAFGGGGGGIRF